MGDVQCRRTCGRAKPPCSSGAAEAHDGCQVARRNSGASLKINRARNAKVGCQDRIRSCTRKARFVHIVTFGMAAGFFGQNVAWPIAHLQIGFGYRLFLGVGSELGAILLLPILFKRRG